MAQRSIPAPFLAKTYQLVEDPSTDDVISWNESGTAFCGVENGGFRQRFASDLLQAQQLLELRSPTQHLCTGDLGSTSTSSPASKTANSSSKNPFADLSDENKKLKIKNESLSSELAQTKKQCEALINFLTERVKVSPNQINHIMRQGSWGSTHDGSNDHGDNEGMEEENEDGLKLFGVWVKENKKKRGRDENLGFEGEHHKEMKTVDFDVPWMTSKVVFIGVVQCSTVRFGL
ncbi:hypothetical protein Acr_09g0002520 [Actinidia rufa]|uniref:HSF-type DNA-binding domain-containing protein n=1 Tax=Actinidia rufa TaxID=165716 RepID=A0A7J0F5W6_9ERIC|nr:hypothetical protein Acr_09g0002520 [Actinidia rufa]